MVEIPDSEKNLPAKQGGPAEVQTAWKILAGGAPTAAKALVDIADHGKSEVARVQAATAVLDRVGLATPKERPDVHFTVIPKEYDETPDIGKLSPAEVIRKRLADLQGPTQALVQGVPAEQLAGLYGEASDPGEVLEAELVPLEDAQDDDSWGNPWAT